MRLSILVLISLASFATPRDTFAQADPASAPWAESTGVLRDLTVLDLVQGRLRIDQNRWLEAAYPASLGDQSEQIVEDSESHHSRRESVREILEYSPKETLNLYAANKFLNRARLESSATNWSGGVSSSGARHTFSTPEVAASCRIAIDPHLRITIDQQKPKWFRWSVNDDPNTLFRISYGGTDRSALLTQNNAGRIHVVCDGVDQPLAMAWPTYEAMVTDGGEAAQRIKSDLSGFQITLPAVPAQPVSAIDVPPSNLTDGPLPNVRRALGDLVPIRHVEGRLSLDRDHWQEAANRATVEEPDPGVESPLGVDPFQGRDPFGNRNRRRRYRWTLHSPPFDELIRRFGVAIARSGESSSGNPLINTTAMSSRDLAALFLTEKESDRIQMSFTEFTRHGRVLTVDEVPGKWFSLVFSDPDYTVLLTQDSQGVIHTAHCDGLEHGSAMADSYAEMVQQNDNGLIRLNKLLELVGITLPPL